jgi:2-methylcitrate dehydratase PrpD
MADTFVHQLAAFAAQTVASPLPGPVSVGVRRSLLDVLGVALAARDEEPARIALEVMSAAGAGGEATVLASGRRLPMSAAAMVNGTMAHALDFDDTHLPSVLHPSASVVPAVLAVSSSSTGCTPHRYAERLDRRRP